MTIEESIRFLRAPIFVVLSLALTGSNADHCDEAPKYMVDVLPCAHNTKKSKEIFGYYKEEEPPESEERTPGLPAGVEYKKNEDGGYETQNVTMTGASEDDVYVPPDEGDDTTMKMKLDQHYEGEEKDARENWGPINNAMWNMFPDGTALSPDLTTIIFPDPPEADPSGDDYCMRDAEIGYPQPLEIGEDGDYTLKYPDDQSITFPAHYRETTVVDEDGTIRKETTQSTELQLQCKSGFFGSGKWFGRCSAPAVLGEILGPLIGKGHRLLFVYTGPDFSFTFDPTNDPTYDGGTYGHSGPVTRWNMDRVVDSERATLRLDSIPKKNKLREPEECEYPGREEYWTLYCSGNVSYAPPVQPSPIPCCPDPCPDDDSGGTPGTTT